MPSAAIYDCKGARLSKDERALFAEIDPWGFIVFARHCETAEALRAHCDELRDCVGRDAPILVDQEGGRVARLKAPNFRHHEAPAVFGDLYRLDRNAARKAARLNARLLGRLVSDLGVNVDCVPSLDVPQIDSDPVTVGDRTLAKHPDTISDLGRSVIEGLLEGGAVPVIKHMPGLGRVLCDSHHALPRVSASMADLAASDFPPFKALNDAPMGMTCHVVFEVIDADAPATLSKSVVQDIIRGQIGFDGLLITDDLKMKALDGGYDERARKSLEAGCDIALCCNLNLAEKQLAAKGVGQLAGASLSRADAAMARLPEIHRTEVSADYALLAQLLAPVTA